MNNNSGIGRISEYEYFLSIVSGSMPTCPRETKKNPEKKTPIPDYNAFEHSITTQIHDIQTLTELSAAEAPIEIITPTQEQPPIMSQAESVETLVPKAPINQVAPTDDSMIKPIEVIAESVKTIAPQTPTDQVAPTDDSMIKPTEVIAESVKTIAPQTLNNVPAPEEKQNGIERKTDTNAKISSEQLPQEGKTEEVPKQPKIAEPIKPLPKGSFTAKFANTFSKELVFVVENLGYVDRTLNESFKLAGYDYTLNMNSYTYTRGFMHSVLSIVDAFTTEKYQYLPILSTVAFNVNLYSRILNDHNPLIQCTLETVYGSLKNIVYNSFPTTFALSTAVNLASCLNRELNDHSSKEYIASVLNTIRSLLYFQSPSYFIKLTTIALRTGWDIKDMYDLYLPLLDSKEDLILEIRSDICTEAVLNTLNYEADLITNVTSDTCTEAISNTLGNINSTEIPIF